MSARQFFLPSLVVALGLLCSGPARSAPPIAGDTVRLVRIAAPTAPMVKALAEAGADIVARRKDRLEVMVPPKADLDRQPALARALGQVGRFEVIDFDPESAARNIAQAADLGLYHTLAEVKAELDAAVAAHPDVAHLESIGKSLQGRDIWALRLGRSAPGTKPAFLFTGLHHSREWISIEVPMGLIKTLTTSTDPAIARLADEREIWVVPVVNPDGLTHSQTSYQMWRKNRRDNGDGSFGVDPNRNYGYKWGGAGASDSPSSDTYRGAAAFSEPCTQAIRDLATRIHPSAAISFHSYSELVLYPWGYTEEPTPDADVFAKHAAAMAQFNGYTPEQSIELYATTGDFDDFMYGQLHILAYTIELGQVFIPPETEIAGIVEKNVKCCIYLAQQAAEPFPVVAHTPPPTTTDLAGPYSVTATLRSAAAGSFVPTSLAVEWRGPSMDSVQATPMVEVDGAARRYEAKLPSTGIGTYQYAILVTGQDGSVRRFPEQGTYEFRVTESLWLIVADDGGKNNDAYYTRAMGALGLDYMVWRPKTQGAVSQAMLAGATGVIWFTGSEYSNTLTAQDQQNIGAWLTAGGRLILFGQDIAYEIKESAFLRDHLKAKFIKDTSDSSDVVGKAPLEGLNSHIGAGTDGVRQQYPDVIEALAGAVPLVTYGSGTATAAVTVTTPGSRVAYLGFGLEGINGEAQRLLTIKQLVSWVVDSPSVALAQSQQARTSGSVLTFSTAAGRDAALVDQLLGEVRDGRSSAVAPLMDALKSGSSKDAARRTARALVARLGTETGPAARDARKLLIEALGR